MLVQHKANKNYYAMKILDKQKVSVLITYFYKVSENDYYICKPLSFTFSPTTGT